MRRWPAVGNPAGETVIGDGAEGGIMAGLIVIRNGGVMEGHDDVRVCASLCPPSGYSNIIDTKICDGKFRILRSFYQ